MSVSYLLEHACPSIKYRTRRDLLEENIHTSIMKELQAQIVSDPKIVSIFESQKEDGWLGGLFHAGTTYEPESGIRYLCERGVEPDHPVIKQALYAIKQHSKDYDNGSLVHVGKVLDENHLGGSMMIKASIFAYAGNEEEIFVRQQIEEALSAFQYVTGIPNIEEICRQYKNKLVFKDKCVKWPSIYHLRLLAYTYSWRNTENLNMLTKAFHRLVELSPIPNINLLCKSQLISPAHIFMNDFSVDLNQITAKDWMMWFHRTEMIARLGIADRIPSIRKQIQSLQKILAEDNGIFLKNLSHSYFNKWTDYSGLALEDDWKTKERKRCDLTFRSLLILKYSGFI